MKHYFLFFALLFLYLPKGYTQYTDVIVKEMPTFTYYDDNKKEEVTINIKTFLDRWVSKHPDAFTESKKNKHQGVIVTKFNVNTQGELILETVTAPHSTLENDARKLYQTIPKLNPAKDQNDKPIQISFTYTINYITN